MKLIISLKCSSFWERLVAWITTFPTALGYTYKIYLIGMLPVYTRHTHIPILKAFSQKKKEINFTVPSERTSSECWTLQICPRVKRNPSCSLCPSVCVCFSSSSRLILLAFSNSEWHVSSASTLLPWWGRCVVENWQGKMSSTCTQMVMDGLSACDRSALPAIYRNVNPGLCFTFLTYRLAHAANDMLLLFFFFFKYRIKKEE